MGWKDAPIVDTPAWESAPLVDGGADIPQSGVPLVGTRQQTSKQPSAVESSGFLKNFLGGGEALLSMGTAIPASIYGTAVGLSNQIRSGQYGTPQGAKYAADIAAQSTEANTYRPRTASGQEQLEAWGNLLKELAPVSGLAGEVNTLARGAKTALPAVKDATAALAEKTAYKAMPVLDPETAKLLRFGQEKNLGTPRLDQVFKSRTGRAVGSFLENDVPLGGGKADQRLAAWNKALIDEYGGDSSSGRSTGDVFGAARTKVGERIGDIYGSTTLNDVAPLLKRGELLVNDARYSSAAQTLVKTYLDDLKEIGKSGAIDGAEFKKWNSTVLKRLRDQDPAIISELEALQKAAFTEFRKTLPAEMLPELDKLRYQYSFQSRLAPAVAKAQNNGGVLNPADVNQAVFKGRDATKYISEGKGGPPALLAAYGKRFIEEPGMKTSAPERYLMYRTMGALSPFGAGALATGTAAGAGAVGAAVLGGGVGVANLYNRLGPAAVRMLAKERTGLIPPKEGFNPSLAQGFDPSKFTTGLPTRLGDLTPEWQTAPGAGGGGSGLFPNVPLQIKKTGVPYQEKMGPLPETPRDLTIPTNVLEPDAPVIGRRLRGGLLDMPAVEGLPGLDDLAIAGRYWTDASAGVTSKPKTVRPNGPDIPGKTVEGSIPGESPMARMKDAPMAVGGIELSRIINMRASGRRTKLLNDFKKRYPQAAAYIDENK